MKNILAIVALLLFFPGCGNLSPISDMQNDIDNQGGQIQELQELQIRGSSAQAASLHWQRHQEIS